MNAQQDQGTIKDQTSNGNIGTQKGRQAKDEPDVVVSWNNGGKTVKLVIKADGKIEERQVVKKNEFSGWVTGIEEIKGTLDAASLFAENDQADLREFKKKIKIQASKLEKIANEMNEKLQKNET